MNRAVFMDRDGVINPLVYNQNTGEYESPHVLEDFSVYPWLIKSLRILNNFGFCIFVVSNQPSYAKGKTTLEKLQAIEKLLSDYVEENGCLINKYYYCYHHPKGIVSGFSGPCDCRKPGTLFLEQAAKEFDLDLATCFFIGDQDTDIQCGKNAGMKTIKIHNKHSKAKSGLEAPDIFADNLYDAAKMVINLLRKEGKTMHDKDYVAKYLQETSEIVDTINQNDIVNAIQTLRTIKNEGGRLFILGVGGSAANASHAVNDFRKLAGIETYAPTDNVSELTARVNDDGWHTTFNKWLETSRLNEKDGILIFSVGGGSQTTSLNIKEAIDIALQRKSKIIAIVSRDGGYAKSKADACVLVPVVSDDRITPHAEGWQGVVWHLIVNAIALRECEKSAV